MSSAVLDLKHTLRSLARRPLHVVVTVGSMAIGIGATTGVYAWLDNLVLRPLPLVPAIDRVVAFNGAAADGTSDGAARVSFPAFQEWQRGLGPVATMAVTAPIRLTLRAEGAELADPAWGLLVSSEYFTVLGVPASRGRTLAAEDDRDRRPVAVIGDHFWRQQLGSDPAVVGRHLWVNGHDLTVIGVMPPQFAGHDVGYAFDLWVPLSQQPFLMRSGDLLADPAARWLSGIARLAPGQTLATANQQLSRIATRTSEAQGERPVTSAAFIPLREWRAGSVFGPLLSALLLVAGLVLLLSCANVAGLAIAKHASAARETGVRLALGAGRADLMRRFLIESALLTLTGGVGGLLLALGFRAILPAMIPPTPQPVRFEMTFNWRIAMMALGAAVVTLMVAGLLPAIRASRLDPLAVIRGTTPGRRSGRSLGQRALVVIQVAVASVALVVALFFLASLRATNNVNPGFSHPEEVLLLGLDFNAAGIDPVRGGETLDRVLAAIRRQPGVGLAAAATMVPLGAGGHRFAATRVEGYDPPPTADMSVEQSQVSPGYFETMGIAIVRGRSFADQDRATTAPVAVVNEAFANHFWPGQDPIGRRVDQGRGWAVVVGVAGDGRYDNLSDPAKPIVFWPLRQWYRPAVTIHVRTAGAPRRYLDQLRRGIAELDPTLVPLDPRTLAEHASVSTYAPRLGSIALGIFGTLALGLAMVGLYAIVAFTARSEMRDTAIRLAIGATGGQVGGRVVGRALQLSGVGVAVGLAGGIALVNGIADRLPGTRPTDLGAYLIVVMVVAVATAAAAFWPARRATRHSLVAVMREEG